MKDDDEPIVGERWSRAARLEVGPGPAHEVHPRGEQQVWSVVEDPDELREVVAVLVTATPAVGLPVPALAGVSLVAYDADGDWIDSVHLVAPTLVQTYSRDYVLDRPLPPHLFPASTRVWAPDLDEAMDRARAGVLPEGRPELTRTWDAEWAPALPLSYLMRGHDRWVRFHSLPRSKRYAETGEEYAEILRRHHAVLRDLAAPTPLSTTHVWVVTYSWSGTEQPTPRPAPVQAVAGDASHWRSLVPDPRDATSRTHLYVQAMAADDVRIDQLLLLAADDVGPMLLGSSDWSWVYAPYDGGADVFAGTRRHRDRLAQRYADWLSPHPAGL